MHYGRGQLKYLLPSSQVVKIHSGVADRGTAECLSTNQRPRKPSLMMDLAKKNINLVEDDSLHSIKFC